MPQNEFGDKISIAFLLSGGGTTLANLLDEIEQGTLPVEIKLVISSSPRAKGVEIARSAGLKTEVVQSSDFPAPAEFSETIFNFCREADVDYVVMGGFLKHVVIPEDFAQRVTNIHPSLIPAFCGKGYYGTHVHEAVLAYGAHITGVTVHFVDNEYDHGPIIAQRAVEVLPDDSVETLQKRVFYAECQVYPEALRLLARKCLRIHGRRVERR